MFVSIDVDESTTIYTGDAPLDSAHLQLPARRCLRGPLLIVCSGALSAATCPRHEWTDPHNRVPYCLTPSLDPNSA